MGNKNAFTPQPVDASQIEAKEWERLDFEIESSEQDIKNMNFSVNTALGIARRQADEEGNDGLARLWQNRADCLRQDVKAKQEALRAAKDARRKMMQGAQFAESAD